MRLALLAALGLALSAAVVAQTSLTFEAASIKRNDGSVPASSLAFQPGGRVVATNVTVAAIVRLAVPATNRVMVGAPPWLTTERYDINASAGREATREELQQMLRSMLEDRMKLRAHLEDREEDVYELVLARTDGTLGSSIRESRFDCDQVTQRIRAGETVLAENGAPACGMSASGGITRVGGQTMADIAASLQGFAGRIVVDRTGLPGRYEFILRASSSPDRATDETPVIFTALPEQLGLKLQPGRMKLSTLVIDYIERPTPN